MISNTQQNQVQTNDKNSFKKNQLILLSGLFLVMVGFGITLPVLSFYIQKLSSADGISREELWLHVGLITSAYPLMQFLFAPYLGSLSDRIGRRPLILTGLAGYAVAIFLFATSTNLIMLYFFRLLSGLFSAAFLTASSAYIADNTSEEKRGKGMASLISVSSLGAVAGPLIGNLFSGATLTIGNLKLDSFSLPFIISSGLAVSTVVFIYFMLPELKKVKETKIITKEQTNKKPVFTYLKSATHSFILLLFFSFTSQFALSMFEGTFALHSQRVFSFGTRQMSMVFIVCGSVMGLLQLGPVGWLIKIWGEKKLLPFGLFILAAGMSLLMIPKKLAFILLFVSIISVGLAILTPALASLITKDTGKNYGTSLGIFSAINSLGQVLGVLAGSVLMIYFNHLPYFLVSFILCITAFFSTSAFRPKKINI